MSSTNEVVCSVLAYHTNCNAAAIRPADRLYDDLGVTTLALALVLLDLEETLDIQLMNRALASLLIVGDLFSAVHAAVGEQQGSTTPLRVAPASEPKFPVRLLQPRGQEARRGAERPI